VSYWSLSDFPMVTQYAFHSPQGGDATGADKPKRAEYAPKRQIQLVACKTTLSFDRVCPGTEQTVTHTC
jgi:hypothetical protein